MNSVDLYGKEMNFDDDSDEVSVRQALWGSSSEDPDTWTNREGQGWIERSRIFGRSRAAKVWMKRTTDLQKARWIHH